ncbi:ATP-binding protein [Paenibacillus sp. OV219]|uniref:sensor histidine kinase n=1 Tax=Paenibacillus sp. OV219 TaxID=1884377 RepID=UPI0008BA5C7F|nr:ATP-binding protein [Paenibacillus sp. OV219]SEM78497.1 His Kinase A (phospho-acceptor) domain-containing protein [Paenibacillus sp. OV219]
MGNPRFQEVSTIRRHLCYFLLLVIPLLGLTSCSVESKQVEPVAKQGTIDLRSWQFETDGQVELSGQWAFYAGRLLQPGDAVLEQRTATVRVPRSWNSYRNVQGIDEGQGYATYKLTALIQPTDHVLAMRLPNIFSSYKLWVNGKELVELGHVGTSRSGSKAEQFPKIVSFNTNSDKLEIVIQVSNFQHRKGGIWVPMQLGDSDSIVDAQMKTTAKEMLILGSLIIIGVYHIGLYAFRRQEQFTMHFGLLCLFVAARASVTGENYLLRLFPISWEAGLKIEYIAFALSAVTGFLYVYKLFPLDASKRVIPFVTGIGLSLCVFVLLSPAIIFSKQLPLFQLFVVGVAIYSLAVLITARMRRRIGSTFVLTGLAVFVVTVLNDMLFFNEWLVYTQLVPLGLFFFMLMQSFIISRRFSNAMVRVEHVSNELRELNIHLEERIEERTVALSEANATLAQTNRELQRSETSRRHLMTNISHDLRTPITLLQGYLEAFQDGVVQSEQQQQRYIRMMLGKVGGLNRLIRDLFELTKLEAGQTRFDFAKVPLGQWIQQLHDMYEIDVISSGLRFSCDFHSVSSTEDGHAHEMEQQNRILLSLDLARMDQVLANVVYNAIKHTPRGGEITLSFFFEEHTSRVIVTVSDTGSGIADEHLPYIFDRFYKKDVSRNSADGGSGLGLAIAKEIVEAHDGAIGAVSTVDKGTMIWFMLPAEVRMVG